MAWRGLLGGCGSAARARVKAGCSGLAGRGPEGDGLVVGLGWLGCGRWAFEGGVVGMGWCGKVVGFLVLVGSGCQWTVVVFFLSGLSSFAGDAKSELGAVCDGSKWWTALLGRWSCELCLCFAVDVFVWVFLFCKFDGHV